MGIYEENVMLRRELAKALRLVAELETQVEVLERTTRDLVLMNLGSLQEGN